MHYHLLFCQSLASMECFRSVLTPPGEALLVFCQFCLTHAISVDINLTSKYQNLHSSSACEFSFDAGTCFSHLCARTEQPRNAQLPEAAVNHQTSSLGGT